MGNLLREIYSREIYSREIYSREIYSGKSDLDGYWSFCLFSAKFVCGVARVASKVSWTHYKGVSGESRVIQNVMIRNTILH